MVANQSEGLQGMFSLSSNAIKIAKTLSVRLLTGDAEATAKIDCNVGVVILKQFRAFLRCSKGIPSIHGL